MNTFFEWYADQSIVLQLCMFMWVTAPLFVMAARHKENEEKALEFLIGVTVLTLIIEFLRWAWQGLFG